MKKKNIILSYPRSGSHLCRFFIELLSEVPTYGCSSNPKDTFICHNTFEEVIPFNIDKKSIYNNNCYRKYHSVSRKRDKDGLGKNTVENLILIIRNPREVLVKQCKKINIDKKKHSYEDYFLNIDYFNNFNGNKLLLYYEDIITNKIEFIEKLYNFLELNKIEKKKYILTNIDKLYYLSLNGKNRSWGGCKSNGELNCYYKNISLKIKDKFDNYLEEKLNNYPFLKQKYNI